MSVKYPIGIQNFEKLRKDGYIYVDKTALMYQLVDRGSYYFLSRPRRFGKSLLISTLEAYFEGKRELFEGLAVEKLEKDWVKRPVLHLDLNTEKYEDPESLENILNDTLCYWERIYGTEPSETSLPLRFKGIIRQLVDTLFKVVVQLLFGDAAERNVFIPHRQVVQVIECAEHTIKDYDREFGTYYLGFPNREVDEGFMKFLLPFYTDTDKVNVAFHITKFVREVRSGDYDAFFLRLQSFFADTPYELVRDLELHYQNVLFIVYKLIGFYVKAEYHTSQGRIDLLLQTDKFIYVMEFKFEGTAEEALRQINEKNYALPFASDPRKLFKIGINFSNEMRNIERWVVVE